MIDTTRSRVNFLMNRFRKMDLLNMDLYNLREQRVRANALGTHHETTGRIDCAGSDLCALVSQAETHLERNIV